jgi:hypothetical protein
MIEVGTPACPVTAAVCEKLVVWAEYHSFHWAAVAGERVGRGGVDQVESGQ